MKKLVTLFIATLLASSVSAQPDKDWWACQFVKSVGMKWENGRWETANFKLDPPFVLMSDGNGGLTEESVAKMIDGHDRWVNQITCHLESYDKTSSCHDGSGVTVYFDPATGNGGMSKLMGATLNSEVRDTVSVDPFTCTKG